MDDFVRIARMTVEKYVQTGRKLTVPEVESAVQGTTLENMINTKAGAFVSIHKHGELRGCIGTIAPTCDNLFEEIVYSAISACSGDPRFYPVTEEELQDLEIKVDRLYPAEVIDGPEELDVVRYGVIVEKGHRRGLLLPNLEGVENVKDQVAIALRKAGIASLEGTTLYRFEVERHG